MIENLIEGQKILENFAKIGFKVNPGQSITGKSLSSFFGGMKLTPETLKLTLDFASLIGEENFVVFINCANGIKHFGSTSRLNDSKKLAVLIKKAGRPIGDIINNPYLINLGGVKLRPGEKPFNLGIEIPAKGHVFFKYFFTIRLGKKNIPEIVLGNFHITNPRIINKFETEQKIGRFPEFIITLFTKTFSRENAVIAAANTKMHQGYQNPHPLVILHNLRAKGELNTYDSLVYANSPEFQARLYKYRQKSKANPSHAKYTRPLPVQSRAARMISKLVDSIVESELKRVQHQGTVSHKIAYKKAGFSVKKRRIQKNPVQAKDKKQKSRSKIAPLWRLRRRQ